MSADLTDLHALPWLSNSLTSKISTHIIAPQANNQLLHYMYHSRFPKRARTRFPLELFEAHKDMVIRTDLESVGIDICNMEVGWA